MSIRLGDGYDGPQLDVTNFLTPGVLLGLIIVVVALILLATIAGWLVLRRLRKHGALETHLLRAQTQLLPAGTARDAVELRLSLREAVQGAARDVQAAAAGDPTLADLPRLVQRLTQETRAVDLNLADLHPVAPSNGRQQLTLLRAQAEQLITSAEQLRNAVRDVALPAADSDQLAADMKDTLEVLAARREALRELRAASPTVP